MSTMQIYLIALIIILSVVANSEVLQSQYNITRPIRDRFQLIASIINNDKVEEEINDFTNYKCEKMVVIRNKAESVVQLTCNSFHDDTPKIKAIDKGNSLVFSLRPQTESKTKFWCIIKYKQYLSQFDVYNEDAPDMCPREMDDVYQYTITHEGIFVDCNKGSENRKIRSLAKGRNKYMLWETYENEEIDDYLIGGQVDGGMCDDIPEPALDKATAVTVCQNDCVNLYERAGCSGKMQTVQASNGCVNVPIDNKLLNTLRAVKGC